MSTDASWQQAANLLTLVSNKGTPAEQIQRLYRSGLLADLFDANVDEVNRDEFRRVLGLKKPEPVLDTLIRVDRSSRLVYPYQVVTVMHPELEPTGPAEYDLATIDPWLHDGQKNGRYMESNKLYEYLKEQKMLESCLSLRDGEEIQKKGIAVFRKFFQGKSAFLWKSVVQIRNGNLSVPFLIEGDGVMMGWHWLANNRWHGNFPTLRFASQYSGLCTFGF